jgi:hypothetical protein
VPRPKLVRFVVYRHHWRSGRRSGIFQALDEVFEDSEAPSELRHAAQEISDWFNANLRAPFRDPDFQSQPDWKIEPTDHSLSWIKQSSTDHLSKLKLLKASMEEAGWLVEELTTTKPGKVLYEDEHQVVAVPYAETPT